jgi:O-antigen/teichoic acid export membrane protein
MVFLQGLSRFMVAADARDDGKGLSEIVSSMAPVLLTVASIIILGGLVGTAHIDALIKVDPAFRSDAQIMLVLLTGMLALTVATTPFRVGLVVRMRFVEQNLIVLATECLRIGILLSLLFGVSTRALWVVVASTAGGLANVLILVILTFKILPEARFQLSLVSPATIRRLLGFSFWTLAQGFNGMVLRALPALLLNRYATAIDVTAFYVGNVADVQIRKLVAAATSPAMPALTTIYAKEGEQALQNFYYMGGRYFLWATLFLTPPLLIFSVPLMDLYVGAKYQLAATVMVLILGAYPFTWASAMFYQISYAVGRIRIFNLSMLFLGVVAMIAMWYLVGVRDLGAVGAAVGLGGTYALVHLLVIWPLGLGLVKGNWGVFARQTLLLGLAPFATALIGCLLYGRFVTIDSWLSFFGGCAVSAIVYTTVLFGACLSPGDRKLLAGAVKKISSKLMPGKEK